MVDAPTAPRPPLLSALPVGPVARRLALIGVFRRRHSAEAYEGTGVGLAISRRVIERHGRQIRAEVQPDRGATFSITLAPGPRAEPAPAAG